MTEGTCALVPELSVSNIARSRDFYTMVLGFRVVYDRSAEGFALLEREGAQIMLDELGVTRDLSTAPLEQPFGRGINLEIKASDAAAILRDCRRAGSAIFLDLETKWYRAGEQDVGVKQFVVSDPDGYLLRFSQRIGTRPAET